MKVLNFTHCFCQVLLFLPEALFFRFFVFGDLVFDLHRCGSRVFCFRNISLIYHSILLCSWLFETPKLIEPCIFIVADLSCRNISRCFMCASLLISVISKGSMLSTSTSPSTNLDELWLTQGAPWDSIWLHFHAPYTDGDWLALQLRGRS